MSNNNSPATDFKTAKRKRNFAATGAVLSTALATVAPIMALPAGYAAYKTYKHHRNKRSIEEEHPELVDTSNVDKFNANVRQVTRHFSRGFIGLSIAGSLSPVLPHMVLPAGMNVYILHRAEKDRKDLVQQMEAMQQNGTVGLRIRKRDVARGVARVTCEKMVLVPMTLGHDDLVLAFPMMESATEGLMHAELVATEGFHEFNELANAPVAETQEELGILTSEQRLEIIEDYGVDIGGWNEAPAVVAENVVIAGTAAAAVEYAIDRPMELKNGKLQDIDESQAKVEAK
ncbi:hypothetical protein BS50DRAFT_673835 [Corynespora cassiicola Philippines]|uniref:Uncharacterized protein n=1 Tax=Corynespora cassiicola Philippines TaxID=1448308 RepID=A0A2T2P0N2_CORCC|nr:hypothetical protein BS50DRAFT_673835 [Corynespora cassiicola Philippines]